MEPDAAIVMEDAVSGVQAAKAGRWRRSASPASDDAKMLAAANADLVVETLDEVDLEALSDGRLSIAAASP